jgi:tetratricopeptide (TPR) repeat protein
MRQGTCCQCGLTTSIRSFYTMNGGTYCEPCVWKAAREAKAAGRPTEYVAVPDHSVCARCGAYSGDTADHPLVGKLPLCGTCAPQVANWPYPSWLKTSLAVLMVLLAFALLHGRQYFHAGRAMYMGERLVEERQYEQALPYLQQTLQIAPDSDKAALLAAKAALLSGNVEVAQKALDGHDGGHFEVNDDFRDVETIWNRATGALKEADQAYKLGSQEGHTAEAAQMMHEASAAYPEAAVLAFMAETFDEGAAYERKDYDGFLAIARKQWKEHPGANTSATVASALACKYAVTGNPTFKQEAEEMLEAAKKQTQGDRAQEKIFAEYVERIHYRIESRQIISQQEFDRRFRSGQAKTSQ